MAAEDIFDPARVHPRFLLAQATVHPWPFSAIAELIDNAYDANAKEMKIDFIAKGGREYLKFEDDGDAMDKRLLLNMLSFGFCEKETDSENRGAPIGKFGSGFKSGSMRLGQDVVVLTVTKKSACAGYLSQTLLTDIRATRIITPWVEYSLPNLQRVGKNRFAENLSAIAGSGLFLTEDELKAEFLSMMEKGGGTTIYVLNLTKGNDGCLELDFSSNPKDIKCPRTTESEAGPRLESNTYKESLREYCEILFKDFKMAITLRGVSVRPERTAGRLTKTQEKYYQPRNGEITKIIFGRPLSWGTFEDYGMRLYSNNRLILIEKVRCQIQGKARGVIGVTEANYLDPILSKQDFVRDRKFNNAMQSYSRKLLEYWTKNFPEEAREASAIGGKSQTPKKKATSTASPSLSKRPRDDENWAAMPTSSNGGLSFDGNRREEQSHAEEGNGEPMQGVAGNGEPDQDSADGGESMQGVAYTDEPKQEIANPDEPMQGDAGPSGKQTGQANGSARIPPGKPDGARTFRERNEPVPRPRNINREAENIKYKDLEQELTSVKQHLKRFKKNVRDLLRYLAADVELTDEENIEDLVQNMVRQLRQNDG